VTVPWYLLPVGVFVVESDRDADLPMLAAQVQRRAAYEALRPISS
jgi:hypothetical protein